MIRVSVEGKKHIEKIKIFGHADYEDYGKDIVCSSVSSIVTTTVNGIYEIDNTYLRVEAKEEGNMIITILKEDKICDKLINNMLSLLSELEESYPENIKVK